MPTALYELADCAGSPLYRFRNLEKLGEGDLISYQWTERGPREIRGQLRDALEGQLFVTKRGFLFPFKTSPGFLKQFLRGVEEDQKDFSPKDKFHNFGNVFNIRQLERNFAIKSAQEALALYEGLSDILPQVPIKQFQAEKITPEASGEYFHPLIEKLGRDFLNEFLKKKYSKMSQTN